jgi:hypothetical protein
VEAKCGGKNKMAGDPKSNPMRRGEIDIVVESREVDHGP